MEVEPQMQRRWEEQLAGYIVPLPGHSLEMSRARCSVRKQAGHPAILFFGAKLVHQRELSVGELIAFTCWRAGSVPRAAAGANMAGFSSGGDCRSTASAIFSIRRPSPVYNPGKMALARSAADISFEHVASVSHRRQEILHDIIWTCLPPSDRNVGTSDQAKALWPNSCSPLTAPKAVAWLIDGVDAAQVTQPGCASDWSSSSG